MTKVLLSVILLLCLGGPSLHAQDDGQPIYSQECFASAKAKAQDTITSPMLTSMGTFPINNAPFFGSSRFALSTAKATAWLFTFRSSLDAMPIVVLSYKSKLTGQCVSLELPTDSSKVPHYTVNESSLQSDSLMAELLRNNSFISILVQHNELAADTALFLNADELQSDLYPPGANMWVINFHYDGGVMTCIWDATNRSKSICDVKTTSVENEDPSTALAYVSPSPAQDYALLQLPSEQAAGLQELKVYDARGVACFGDRNLRSLLSGSSVVLPVQQLSTGTYFVHISVPGRAYTIPLTVQR